MPLGYRNIEGVVFVVHFLQGVFGSPTSCTSVVSSCPTTASEWFERSKKYNCTEGKYTCTQNMHRQYLETCLTDDALKTPSEEQQGCPFVKGCHDGYPVIGYYQLKCSSSVNLNQCTDPHIQETNAFHLYNHPECLSNSTNLNMYETKIRYYGLIVFGVAIICGPFLLMILVCCYKRGVCKDSASEYWANEISMTRHDLKFYRNHKA